MRVHTFSKSLLSIPIDRGFKPDIGFSDRTCLSLSELRELVPFRELRNMREKKKKPISERIIQNCVLNFLVLYG